jgi:hypothetical protein
MELKDSQWNILHCALFICATDGLISETEEETVINLFTKQFPSVSKLRIEAEVDKFFSSNEQLESYAKKITQQHEQKLAISISQTAASSDGLDYRENFALKRLLNLWDLEIQGGANGA